MASPNIPILANLQQVEPPPSGKRRTETRYQCGPATPGRLVTARDTKPLRAWVLNLSTHGVGLLVDQPLETRTEFIICLKSLTTHRTFQLSARIAHCTQQITSDWLLGCELLTPLSEDDLDELL